MNIEALKKALLEVKNSCFLTRQCEEEINNFLVNGSLSVFSSKVSKELSLLYENIILPTYQFYAHEYIPNIFIKLEV